MLGLVARDWWVFAVRGIAAIVFGVLAFIWPEATLTVLVFLFGAYVLVDGVSLLIALARGDAVARRHAWAVGIMGVLGIVAGVVTFVWPGLTALSLLYLVAFWAIATGAFQVIAAIALRRELDGEFWMARWRSGLDRLRRAARRLPGRGTDLARVARRDLGCRLRRLEPRRRLPAPCHRRGAVEARDERCLAPIRWTNPADRTTERGAAATPLLRLSHRPRTEIRRARCQGRTQDERAAVPSSIAEPMGSERTG